ncbi:hypothetical protein EDC04DRAFT_2898122 [Pisolithus marmoratus]|nr:hypothetical protein EDC04DRAFT_2898122 [Pisolithus marmoratus]
MSSVTDSEATINALVNTIHPSFDYIIVITAFSACLFTLFVILFALSTKESRCRLVFRLNALAIFDPFNSVSTSLQLAAIVFTIFPPLLYDSILLTRLFALYPLSSTPLATLLKIFAFPCCVKCTRVVVLALVLDSYVRNALVEGLTLAEATTWFHNPNMTTEWALQIADNM